MDTQKTIYKVKEVNTYENITSEQVENFFTLEGIEALTEEELIKEYIRLQKMYPIKTELIITKIKNNV